MSTIIAPTSFSKSSLNAVNYAADMASDTGSSLLLLHVLEMPYAWDAPVTQYEYGNMIDDVTAELNSLKSQLEIRTGYEVDIDTKVVSGVNGINFPNIYDESRPFIIVIGPERKSITEHFLFGNRFDITSLNLPCPIVMVPENVCYRHIKRICLATDLLDIEDLPLDAISNIVESFNANLNIIHICKNNSQIKTFDESIIAIKKRLADFNPNVYVEYNDNIERGVNEYAEKNKEDLVIVLPKKHTFFNSLLHVSNTKKIGESASVALASVHSL